MKRILRRLILITKYFLSTPSLSVNIKKHSELKNKLAPFKAANLMVSNLHWIYVRKYISHALTFHDKFEILLHHYTFLKDTFSDKQLDQIFKKGMEFYREENYSITLTGSFDLELEGSLSIVFKDEDLMIATLSFTFVPGSIFGLPDENLIYVSRLQQINKHIEKIYAAKKHFKDIMPGLILFNSLEAVAAALKVQHFIGITATNQISYTDKLHQNYYASYDEFWTQNGGELIDDKYYLIPLPIPQKDILTIKQTHRNRARRKRQQLDEIYAACYDHMVKGLAGSA